MANKSRLGYSFKNSAGPGTTFTLIFIFIAVGMGLLLSRGITPRPTYSDPGQNQSYEMIVDTPGPGQNGVQIGTIKFKECTDNMAIDLLLDKSGSMNELTPGGQTKISQLKNAVSSLFQGMQDTSVIGIQSFNDTVTDDVPISYFKDVKSTVVSKLTAITVPPLAETHTRDALSFSLGELQNAVTTFKDKKFNFIFISDGEPCPGVGCTDSGPDQDPRKVNPNPADQIKALGVNVYTIGILSQQNQTQPALTDLLKNIASKPENYLEATTADNIKQLLTQISSKICSEHTN